MVGGRGETQKLMQTETDKDDFGWKTTLFIYIYIYIYIYIILYYIYIISQYSVQCGRLHFATFICNINYKFIYYANLPYSYYSQFTVIIFFDNSVAGYIALLCISIA